MKQTSRRLLSTFFIYTLVILPLVSMDGAVQKAQAQITFCGNYANQIFQNCQLGVMETALTEQAIDDVMALYELPASDRPLLIKHARSEVRAMIYVRLLQIFNKPNPTADEQEVIARFAQRIKDKRIEAAQKAKDEYNRFLNTSCRIYHPPSPYTYNGGYGCYSPLAGFFSRSSPSFEEFQQFGAALAYEDFATPEAQAVTMQTTQGIAAGTGIAAAGIGAAAAAAIGSTITFGTLSAVIPFAGLSFATVSAATASGTAVVATLPAAGAASGAVGASAAAGPAAIIILAVAAAVMEGINVANQKELPGKLDQAITDKQNETIDLRALANGDDVQKQEVYGAFIRITLPEFPDEEAITPNASDPIFTVSTSSNPATDAVSMNYTPWTGQSTTENNEARLSGRSWFLLRNSNSSTPYRMRLSISYQGENGELLTARRRGREFVITSPGNPSATVVGDTLKTRVNNTVSNYKVKPNAALLAVAGASKTDFGCVPGQTNPDTGEYLYGVFLGKILDAGGTAPNQLTFLVNGGAQATVGNLTLKNLGVRTIDNVNYIVADVSADNAAFGESANFTIKVANNSEDTQFTTTIKKTAILDTLPNKLPANLTVGTNYSLPLNTAGNIISFGLCSGFSFSIAGEIPAGLTFVNNHPDGGNESANGDVRLVGTAASDGDYKFTVNKNYLSGEVLSRTYRMTVRGNIAEIPGGVKSWWRAENNAEDFTNRANGTMVGTATFINSKVSRGFYFRGTNGYIQLPDNAFQIASSTQTFETWFKTGANGVILGRQNSNITPYGNAQNLSRPLIYVDKNGKLRSTFGTTEVVSPNAVNNNAYHHVAVTFSEAGGGAVYLDGVNIGANNGRAYTNGNQKFQFGTGFINPGVTGELSGWSNFTGTIDEPAIYDQILSVTQVKAIYAAGAGGKISVSAVSTPPTQHDGNNGTITINAQGGVRQLNYSINNGATFQTTNFFQNLTPGTYQTVVRDGGDRDVRRTVVITNPAPNLSFTTQVTPPQCFGGNASVTIYPSGGSDNYEYSVRNGANVQTSNIFSDIGAGDYIPWIRDANSNTIYTNGTINIPQPTQIVVSPARFTNAALNQAYSQTFTVSGGTPGYSIGVSGDVQTNFQLPAGLTSSVSGNTVTVSGTPTQTGNFNMFFEIYDQNSCRQGVFVPFVITSNQTYNIAGRATNGGQGLANVTITLSGAENRTTTTDANGNYSFATIAGSANYSVNATLTDATFAQPTINLNGLSANLTSLDFTTAATTYEGDFAPRRRGDGAINVLDLVALGRTLMPNNPDARPANGAEFQRADTNPRNNLGNGAIDQNDLTQLRNYIVITTANPRTPSGGAIAPASSAANQLSESEKSVFATPELDLQNLKANFSNAAAAVDAATVSAGTVTYSGSGSATVPIQMTTNGGVQAAQFTINYDANKIAVSAISNQAPANTTLVMNRDITGKITVIINQPIDGSSVFPTGTFDVLRINFSPAQNATGFARIDFGDAPTSRLASDPQANAVALNSNPGGVSITAAPGISGKVINGGKGLSNVTVSRTNNGQTASTITDANGNYYFDNLTTGGNHTIRPELNGYAFTPATQNFNGLSASVTNADFNTSQTTYEGDIATRPTGDGAINASDVTTLGSIIANLDAKPADGAEWQRADIAPKSSLGDGAVNVQDLVQLGLYSATNTKVPASGAITAANTVQNVVSVSSQKDGGSYVNNLFNEQRTSKIKSKSDAQQPASVVQATATLKAVTATANNSNASVPIQLTSSGDTAAIQFTVNYDAAKLSIPTEAAITERSPNTTFVINNNTAGKLVIVAYKQLDGTTTFPTGDITLMKINFAVANNAMGSTLITFGDATTTTGATAQSDSVQVSNTYGLVRISGATAAGVTVKGKVKTPNGRGLINTMISLTNENGIVRTVRTGLGGAFTFDNVAAGGTYILTVTSKRYDFEPQILNVNSEITDVDFTAH